MLENWFRLIRDVYRLHRDYLDSIDDDDERLNKLVELNVIEQCLNLYKTGTGVGCYCTIFQVITHIYYYSEFFRDDDISSNLLYFSHH